MSGKRGRAAIEQEDTESVERNAFTSAQT
ncbi:hypothetical protein RvY_19629, partial [Ramazzottius varieornatus]